jgi:PhnB protein
MASDAPPDRYRAPQGTYVSLNFDDFGAGKAAFDRLAEGGEVQMPFEKTFWAAGFGMLVDRFGTPWMINCNEG